MSKAIERMTRVENGEMVFDKFIDKFNEIIDVLNRLPSHLLKVKTNAICKRCKASCKVVDSMCYSCKHLICMPQLVEPVCFKEHTLETVLDLCGDYKEGAPFVPKVRKSICTADSHVDCRYREK